jgi:shikimate dehydrogenase
MSSPDRYAVFGNPVQHSRSPQIHGLFAQQSGQQMQYEAILAPLDGFEASVRGFIAAGGRGANVTVPFKEEAFRLSSELMPRARAAGAVNTLSFDGKTIRGDNTDGAGLLRDIEGNLGFSLAGKQVLLLGAGGAARGVILPLLAHQPAALVIANRTADKARQLAAAFAGSGPLAIATAGFDQLSARHFDLVINATSTGLDNVELPLPDSVFAPGCLAYEMVYGKDTPFMRQARAAGARVHDGLGMLVEQAAEVFFVWRGVRPDTAPVLDALRKSIAT